MTTLAMHVGASSNLVSALQRNCSNGFQSSGASSRFELALRIREGACLFCPTRFRKEFQPRPQKSRFRVGRRGPRSQSGEEKPGNSGSGEERSISDLFSGEVLNLRDLLSLLNTPLTLTQV
jgi:hypothetical protein